MLLRRITRHLQVQNWLAVGLNFLVVVVGVLFAQTAEQWLIDRLQPVDLRQAEVTLNFDLLNNLFAAREIAAIALCRKERTQLLCSFDMPFLDEVATPRDDPHS